jgi:hypothetical protein
MQEKRSKTGWKEKIKYKQMKQIENWTPLGITNVAVQSGNSGKFFVTPIQSPISRSKFLNARRSCVGGDNISTEGICV